MALQVSISVADASQIGEARRAAARMSTAAGLNDTEAGRVALIVTELATNLVRYGKEGRILLRGEECLGSGCCEVLAMDTGPGMDLERCLVDGYSTGGTPGNGLGAIKRLASEFDIYSAESGTAVFARIWRAEPRLPPRLFQWGCINLPAKYEEECGDSYRMSDDGERRVALMIADGLGHGPEAAAASSCAGAVFDQDPLTDVGAFIQSSHLAMSGSRGAATAIAILDRQALTLQYAGVGNIAGVLLEGKARRGLPSHNGIVGAVLPRVQAFEYPLPRAGMIVMHSDGLQSRWNLDAYPGLSQRHPALIAAILFRDFYRGRDDVTVLVGAWNGGAS